MEIEDIIYSINKHKKQAKQLNPNALVVSVERAERAIGNAFLLGQRKSKEK